MKRSLTRVSAGLAFALAAATVTAVLAGPAGAVAPPLQTCKKVSGSATFTPGLSATPRTQTIKARGNQTGCTPVSRTGSSGVLTATLKVVNGSCGKLATGKQTVKGTAQTTWHNKKISRYALTLVTGTGSNITLANITGTVTAGLFVHHKVTGQIRFKLATKGGCVSATLKSVTFTSTKAFVIH